MRSPSLDLPNLAVHFLWLAWFAALLALWPALGPPARAGMLALGLPLHFWSYAVLHNHMHLPIARPAALRWIVSRTLGLSCGFAYRGYHAHHMNHHRHDNGPGDWGRPAPDESALAYCARWTLTPWVWPFPVLRKIFAAARGPAQRAELVLDLLLVNGGVAALILWRPSLGLSWLGMLLAGQFATFYLNLAAHHESDAADPSRLAVTSTSRLYNALCFNAGHHQAHHARPQEPWRTLPALTRTLESRGQAALRTPLAPVHPRWALRIMMAGCAPPAESRTSSPLPSAAT